MKIVSILKRDLLIVILCLLTHIMICTGLSYADREDKTGQRDYDLMNKYGPNWVMNSVFNASNESKIQESAQKLNDIEKNINTPTPKKENDSDTQSQLILQKKKSGGQTNIQSPTKLPSGGEGQAKGLPDISDPNFITPDKADKAFQDAIASGVHSVAIGDNGDTLNVWNAEDGIHYNIQDAAGNIYGLADNILRTIDGDSKTYLTDLITLPSSYNCPNYAFLLVSTYHYSINDNSYVFEKVSGVADLNFTNGYNNMPDMSYAPLASVESSEYYFKTGYYIFDGGYIGPNFIRDLNGRYSAIENCASSTGDGYLPYTPPTPGSSEPSTPTAYKSILNYNPSHLDDYYLTNKSNDTNTSPLVSNKDNSGSSKPDDFFDTLNKKPRNTDGAKPIDETEDNKLTNPGFYHLTLNDAMSLKDTAILEDIIGALENKQSKTDMEESLLEVAKILEENSAYLDDATLKEFNQIVKIVEVAEDMKGLMSKEDFEAISKGLLKLVQDQRSLYNDYLKVTQPLYDRIATLLGVSITDENLPDTYKPMYLISSIAKKKIAVDLTIERLKTKDSDTLTSNEKEALKADNDILRPMKDEYSYKLRMTLTSFTWDIREILKDKSPFSITDDDSGVKALLFFENKELSKSAQ